jgi:serine/threonine protein kinase
MRTAHGSPNTRFVFAGHRVDGLAGKGGMGVVYRATDVQLERPVALKLVGAELADDPAFAERFKRESRLAASLDHANVIPIYHAGQEDGRLYVTMRFVEGTDLAEVLRRDRRLAPERAVRITTQVAAALDAAHARGLVHRDVKPANILLQEDHVFLTDFGLSKRVGSGDDLTETGAVLGTVDYMAPEQVRGGVVDARSDVYALGCMMFQMLSGRVPFERPNGMAKLFAHVSEPAPRLKDVPDALADVVATPRSRRPRRASRGRARRADRAGSHPCPRCPPSSTHRSSHPRCSASAVSAARCASRPPLVACSRVLTRR